jgi:hypothetical protein
LFNNVAAVRDDSAPHAPPLLTQHRHFFLRKRTAFEETGEDTYEHADSPADDWECKKQALAQTQRKGAPEIRRAAESIINGKVDGIPQKGE